MSYCYKCNEPVLMVPTISDGNVISDKPIPVNLSPDPAGNLALFKWPVLFKGTKTATGGEPVSVARRMYGEAARYSRMLGGQFYRIHWDTCRGRKQRYGRY